MKIFQSFHSSSSSIEEKKDQSILRETFLTPEDDIKQVVQSEPWFQVSEIVHQIHS